jgi:uncharacterized protein (TIGR03437 family)
MKKLTSIAFLLPLVAAWPAAAQNWDTTGNGLLNGTYYFRQVVWYVGDEYGDLADATSYYGNITFNGSGGYTISNVQVVDAYYGSCTIPQGNCSGYPTSGTYSVAASGYGFISSLVASGDEVYGLVSNGIFVGSSTENTSCSTNSSDSCYNDLFIAVPVGSTPLANSAFQGTYQMAGIDFTQNVEISLNGSSGAPYNSGSSFVINPNGSGSIPGFTADGFVAENSSQTSESVPSSSYSFQNNAAVWNISGSITSANLTNVVIAGPSKYLYFSPDGNFVFGGSPQGWDMIVGVRTSSGASPNFSGLYYQAGSLVINYVYEGSLFGELQTYYGSYCTGSCYGNTSNVLAHQRLDDAQSEGYVTYDYGYLDSLTSSGGFPTDSLNQYAFTDGGDVGIGFSTITSAGGLLGVAVLLQAPSFSGPGVYVNPDQIQNAGSYLPFTAQLAPGELISLFGTNLASTTASDNSLPTTLGGTTVMINGEQAPLDYVSPTQINVTVPIDISNPIASIQVINSIGSSNIVSDFVGESQPGVFNSASSLIAGVPAVQHGANYSMVTSSSPAQPGETILLYLTGLGTLSGENSTNTYYVYFAPTNGGSEVQATVSFAGSQSSIGGGYQMNVVVPSGLASGEYLLDILGPDSEDVETLVPVGTGDTSSLRKNSRRGHPKHPKTQIQPQFRRNPKADAAY